MKPIDIIKDRALDSQLALSLIGRDAPHDLIVNRDFITRIGNLCDVPFVRKLNISFNQIKSLDGVDQMPQLRQLYAYACDLDKIECLRALTKVELVMLQQNKISRMGDAFGGLAKLQELRLDQNKIVKIEFLSGCVSLRKLDLSFNNIESLMGLSGLQQLQELKVSNNSIKTLTPLKALPSIKDLDVSNNQLKSLEGLNLLPTLEYVRADHNLISELKMSPFLGANKKDTAKDRAAGADKKAAVGGSSKKGNGGMSEIADLSGPMLVELSLAGNRIRSIEGLEVFKENLETVNLSSNNLTAAEVGKIANTLKLCSKLSELRLHNNPISDDEGALNQLVDVLTQACPALRAVDGLSIVASTDLRAAKTNSSYNNTATAGGNTGAGRDASLRSLLGDLPSAAALVGAEFHTWNDDASAVDTAGSVANTVKDDNTVKDSEDDASESEKEDKEKDADTVESKRFPPNLMLQEMLTPEQIMEKEAVIRDRIKYCKEKLEASVRTVFGFADESEEKKPEPFKARRLLPPTTASASGARVAAALEEAECASRKNSTALAAPAAPVAATASAPTTAAAATPAVFSAPAVPAPVEANKPSSASSATSMKDKLVDRVRMAVSSSVSALSPADQQPNQHTTAARPATTATDEEAQRKSFLSDDRPAFNPDNYFNFPDDEKSSSSSSVAYASAKQESQDDRELDSKSVHSMSTSTHTTKAGHSGQTVGHTGGQHSKGVKSSASAATGTTVLGSGLTRYGTKVKPLAGQSHLAAADAQAQSFLGRAGAEASSSPLRAAPASDVEALDILNLKITKPSQHVYMTEWDDMHAADPRLYPRSAESDSDAEARGDGGGDGDGDSDADREGDKFNRSPFRYNYDVDLEMPLAEPDSTSEIVDAATVHLSSQPQVHQEVVQEVRLRPDDRFGKAMAAYGGAGYDKRAMRRGSEPTSQQHQQSADDTVVGAGFSAGVVAGNISGGGGDAQAGEVDNVLRRSYSAPKLEKPSTAPLQVSVADDSKSASESPPLSPAVSLLTPSASVVSLHARLHPGATTLLLSTTATTAAGSISPRPAGAGAAGPNSSTQPKMKFQIPASARNAINGVMPVTKKARGDSTSDTTPSSMSAVEFSALEQEVLRATKVAAANAKTSRNPTVPLELAQYGPFSPRPGHK